MAEHGQGLTQEELDARGTRHTLAGSSVEISSNASDERTQEVNVRSLPYSHETPEQFKERIENEKE